MGITGRSRLVGVMGWPVKHSRSPQMHNAALAAAGIDAVYVAMGVAPDQIGAALGGLRAMGFRGSNVTIPHKQAVAGMMARLTPQAEIIGAVNTIRVEEDGSLTGHNTDCEGAVRAVEADGTLLRGRTVVILGAGGAGRGAAAGCAFAGARRIVILNRTEEKARALAEELGEKIETPEKTVFEAGPLAMGFASKGFDWTAVDAVLQMTSAGMEGNDPMPMDVGLLRRDCHVLEAVYAPLETPFLVAARERGLPSTDGLAMLLEQGAASFEFWFGVSPDREVMRRALAAAAP